MYRRNRLFFLLKPSGARRAAAPLILRAVRRRRPHATSTMAFSLTMSSAMIAAPVKVRSQARCRRMRPGSGARNRSAFSGLGSRRAPSHRDRARPARGEDASGDPQPSPATSGIRLVRCLSGARVSFDASLRLRRAARPAARGVARHARALSRARAKPLFVSRFALRAFPLRSRADDDAPFPRLFSRRPQVHSAVVSRKAARVSHVVRAADGDRRGARTRAGRKPTKASAFKSMSNDELLAEMTAAKKMLFELACMRQSTRSARPRATTSGS